MHTNAFGQLDGSVPALRIYGQPVVSISEWLGMLIGVTAVAALFGAQLHRMIGVGRVLAIGPALANAVFVPATLLYLNGKAPELKDMTNDRDKLRETLGSVLKSVFGGGAEPSVDTAQKAATAALTNQALLCGLIVAITAAIAVSMRNRIRSADSDAGSLDEVPVPPAADEVPSSAHDGDDAMKRELELEHVLHQIAELLDRNEVEDDKQNESIEVGQQRLLPRGERPHRNDTPSRRSRRDRPSRPQTTSSASDKPQSARWAAASRSGRLATLSHSSPAPLFHRQRSRG
ncbi:hypothetical protein GV792_14135 [Nocardia cyriacigeorgica]|uniref:hypothetical protein n=1 Tax=Nocardia cyriacigeorgica TaxID=135487 RepID=UPI0013B66403|nr:hypothetical protein [Nocardia cyriacigeorgica]NEW51189.1 hypothetical protein [Nocardia cyriacigeorgica]